MLRAMNIVLRGKSKARVASSAFSTAAGSPSQRLTGKVAIITGGASGIGSATAAAFVKNGAKVIIADVQDELGHAVADRLGPGATYTHCDVTAEEQVAAAVDLAVARHGSLDIFHSNAGVLESLEPRPIASYDLADLDRMMAVNLRGAVAGAKHAARVMVPRRSGCILLTASMAAVIGGTGPTMYSISKAAQVGVVRALAGELGCHGVRVNAISPCTVATPLVMGYVQAAFPGMSGDELKLTMASLLKQKDAGPFIEAEDVANAALYLASDEAKYVNGHNLMVDGGYTVWKSAKE